MFSTLSLCTAPAPARRMFILCPHWWIATQPTFKQPTMHHVVRGLLSPEFHPGLGASEVHYWQLHTTVNVKHIDTIVWRHAPPHAHTHTQWLSLPPFQPGTEEQYSLIVGREACTWAECVDSTQECGLVPEQQLSVCGVTSLSQTLILASSSICIQFQWVGNKL